MPFFRRAHDFILSLSIRWKIFLSMMLVAIGITAGVGQFAVWQQEEVIKRNVESTGIFIASSISDNIAKPLALSQYFEIREMISSIAKKDDRIRLITVTDLATPRSEVVAVVGEESWIDGTKEIYSNRVVQMGGVEQYIFFEPVQIRGVQKLLGTVRVGMSLEFMYDRLKLTRDSMIAIMIIAVAAALLLAFVISDTVLKPLRSLTRGILKIAGGEFSHRIEVEGRDETGVLAAMFNHMTVNLMTLQEISAILNEEGGPQEVLESVIARITRSVAGKTGAMVFHGLDGQELVAGGPDETALFYLRQLRSAGRREVDQRPVPLREPGRLCFPFFSEGEVTGGIWLAAESAATIGEIDERLMSGVADQLETTLSKLEFQFRAVTDAMTGLYNHRYFQQEISRLIDRSHRLGRAFTLIMADIDHFKNVNDRFGHPQGDIVLRAVAGAIKKSIRGKIDVPCRYGGEEFAVLLPDTPIEGGKIFAERLRRAVEELSFDFDGTSIRCTISIGIATFPEAAGDKRPLIDIADRALYMAKESGRNNVRTYRDV